MGMFDSIYFKCKTCGEEVGVQSKGGDCLLNSYEHTNVPKDVAEDANRHAIECYECGSTYEFGKPENIDNVYLPIIQVTEGNKK